MYIETTYHKKQLHTGRQRFLSFKLLSTFFILWETAEKPNYGIRAAVSHQFSKNRVKVLPNAVTMSGKMEWSTLV